MKILVPTDFSENAEHALKYAMNLASRINGQIILYHFISIPVYSSDIPLALPSEADLKKDADQRLTEIKEQYTRIFPGIPISCETCVAINFPEDEIINEEISAHADLVIMGTRGSGMRTILGTNTAAVIEESKIPVLAIPEDAEIKMPEKIAFAVNYSNDDLQNILSLIELLKPLRASITIVHVSDHKENLSIADNELEILLSRVRSESNYPFVHMNIITSDDTIESLNDWLSENKFNLLAVSMRKRSWAEKFFGRSMTIRMLYHTHVPLMAFHTTTE